MQEYTVRLYSIGETMKATVARLYEDGGRPLARHLVIRLQPTHFGNFSLSEKDDRDLRRSVRSAYLRDVDTGADVLPQLRDAVVIWVGEDAWTVTGFETDPHSKRSVAQSWYVCMQGAAGAGVTA
jgi:hypothetical protein